MGDQPVEIFPAGMPLLSHLLANLHRESGAEEYRDPDHGGSCELEVLGHHSGWLPLLLSYSLSFLSPRILEPLHQECKGNSATFQVEVNVGYSERISRGRGWKGQRRDMSATISQTVALELCTGVLGMCLHLRELV